MLHGHVISPITSKKSGQDWEILDLLYSFKNIGVSNFKKVSNPFDTTIQPEICHFDLCLDMENVKWATCF